MLDYEWGNPNGMNPPEPEHNGGYDHFSYTNVSNDHDHDNLVSPQVAAGFSLHHQFMPPPPEQQHMIQNSHHMGMVNCVFDQRAYGGAYGYAPPLPAISGGGGAFLVVPKAEEGQFGGSRIGLNLGGRTYFSSSEDDFVSRLYRRAKPGESGSGGSGANVPRCQAEGCAADLTGAKHYHRRHKVCEFHSKASTVVAAGLTQRFCQQCSRFHLLSEFDNGKRSCRKRLADHNRRRRKSAQSTNENQKSQLGIASNLSSDNLAGSPPDSGAHSSSSVTVAISPPRMSLDSFPPARQYGHSAGAASSSSSLFFSSG